MTDPFSIETYDLPAEQEPVDDDIVGFNDIVLEPFSPRRRRLAGLLGLKFFQFIFVEFRTIAEFRTWRGFENDVILTLWVCTQSIDEVNHALAFPRLGLVKANDWADEFPLAPGEPQWNEACEAASKILWSIVDRVLDAPDVDEDESDSEGESDSSEGIKKNDSESSED